MSEPIVMIAPKRWMRPSDLENEFGIKTSYQAQLRSEGKIPYSKRGKFVFYDREKVDVWLEDAAMVS